MVTTNMVSNGNEQYADNKQAKEKKELRNRREKKKTSENKRRIFRLETALGTVMAGFKENSNEFETAILSLENKKIDAEVRTMELVEQNLVSEE